MSLYTQIFGENENADKILDLIDINRENFGRYRDCWLNPEGTIATVLSRVGGGNRQNYEYVYENLKLHIRYIGYKEEPGDSTYVYFNFSIPDNKIEEAKKIAPKEKHKTVCQMFHDEIKEAEEDPESPAAKKMEKIADQIMNGGTTIGNITMIGL